MEKSDFMNESRRSDLMNTVQNQTADPNMSMRSKRNTIELASNKSSGRASNNNPISQRQEQSSHMDRTNKTSGGAS